MPDVNSLMDLMSDQPAPPPNQAVLDRLAQYRAQYDADVARYGANAGPFNPGVGNFNEASQPGMSGYFQLDPVGSIVPRAFSPQEVARQAGLSDARQLMQGFTPSGGYQDVGYNIPNDRGGFFNANASGLPTTGEGLSTNNWRLLGRGPGHIMRQGNIINMLDPNTRSGLPIGVDSAFSDTAESGLMGVRRWVPPGASFSGANKFGYFWPGGSVVGRGAWPWGTAV